MFFRFVRRTALALARMWSLPPATTDGFVMSALGDLTTLANVHRAWFIDPTAGARLAKLILRRRVIDLLRGDARRPHHESLPLSTDAVDAALRALDVERDPRALTERKQLTARVQAALQCFEDQGPVQKRQAGLVKRYVLDEVPRSRLAAELGCTCNALGVRVHKAIHALRKYITVHHPELESSPGPALGGRQEDLARIDAVPSHAARKHLVGQALRS
ncbi:MAG TPA: hypothetical protein VFP84_12465 [Kofleriaceae bacterium]|nr:hypothetical protein [Kofleriaceae bacterium]